MKNAGIWLLFVSASGLLLTACVSQAPVRQAAPAPTAASTAAPAGTVADTRYKTGTRRMTKDGVEYFCERPRPTGSQFIAPREQCYTEEQLKAIRDRDQEFVRRQQSIALQTNTTSVTRTAITP
jgi:hypothetical protein